MAKKSKVGNVSVKPGKERNVFTCSNETCNTLALAVLRANTRDGQHIWLEIEINRKNIMCQWDTTSIVSMVGRGSYKQLDCLPKDLLLKHCLLMVESL